SGARQCFTRAGRVPPTPACQGPGARPPAIKEPQQKACPPPPGGPVEDAAPCPLASPPGQASGLDTPQMLGEGVVYPPPRCPAGSGGGGESAQTGGQWARRGMLGEAPEVTREGRRRARAAGLGGAGRRGAVWPGQAG